MALKKSLTRKVLPPPGEPYIYIFLLVLLKNKPLLQKSMKINIYINHLKLLKD